MGTAIHGEPRMGWQHVIFQPTTKNYRVIQTKGTRMPKYISEERLRNIEKYYTARGISPIVPIGDLIRECQELQEPWMTLDKFFKSGFTGLCWIEFPSALVTDSYFDGYLFKFSSTSEFAHDGNYIARVMPIHKPEPPR